MKPILAYQKSHYETFATILLMLCPLLLFSAIYLPGPFSFTLTLYVIFALLLLWGLLALLTLHRINHLINDLQANKQLVYLRHWSHYFKESLGLLNITADGLQILDTSGNPLWTPYAKSLSGDITPQSITARLEGVSAYALENQQDNRLDMVVLTFNNQRFGYTCYMSFDTWDHYFSQLQQCQGIQLQSEFAWKRNHLENPKKSLLLTCVVLILGLLFKDIFEGVEAYIKTGEIAWTTAFTREKIFTYILSLFAGIFAMIRERRLYKKKQLESEKPEDVFIDSAQPSQSPSRAFFNFDLWAKDQNIRA